jgi:hypothetical protein
MRDYSRELLVRFAWLAFWILMLFGLVYFAFTRSLHEDAKASIFKPQKQIDQIRIMSDVIAKNNLTSDESLETLLCKDRGQQIVTIRLMQGLGWTSQQAQAFIHNVSEQIETPLRCSAWLDNVQKLLEYQRLSVIQTQPLEIESALSEKVAWNQQLPCIYYQDRGNWQILLGNPIRCTARKTGRYVESTQSDATYKAMLSLARSLLVNAPDLGGHSLTDRDRMFTLDSGIQSRLQYWMQCLDQPECQSTLLPRVARHVSVVVMDADTSDILGALCWSGPCTNKTLKPMLNYSAMLTEFPPASTAKLLHALVLAKHSPADADMIENQIKTSGQTDGLVSKRNEWWEKQAICDEQEHAKICDHPQKVEALAQFLHWNQHCEKGSIYCGRVGLLDQSDALVLNGLVGYMHPRLVTQKPVPLMKWSDYDQIRQGKKHSDGSVSYMNTALAIQSVIGAGDTRTSALGLANLSTQVIRLSLGEGASSPHLLRNMEEEIHSSDKEWKSAAQVVLAGMRKVVEPQEKGWNGPGTAAMAYQQAFGKPCQQECGVWAKTGTVSHQDPKFAGVTLFSGVIDVPQNLRWQGVEQNKQMHRRLAIGVVVQPLQGPAPVHLASAVGMKLLSDLAKLDGVQHANP